MSKKEKKHNPTHNNSVAGSAMTSSSAFGAELQVQKTADNIILKPLYLPDDFVGDYSSELGLPGEFPFTRGVYASMYRGQPWTIRQYSGFGAVEETNERFKYLIQEGVRGLSVAFDLPTQMGRDSDDPVSLGEVGKVGVAIDTIEDMEALFDGISLADISTSMTINSTAHILLAFYLVVAERRGIDVGALRGTVQNDILKEYIARGTYVYPPEAGMKISADVIEYCARHVPKWNAISISGYHIREAGSTAAQEIAITLQNGLTYIEEVKKRGISVDQCASQLAFFFNCHNNFFEEIAKFRAARRLWAKLIKERYDPQNKKSLMLRFHTQTAGSSLTAQQPQVNIVRTSVQALAAVLGGTQSLHTNSYDEAISLPSEDAAVLALRTQQVIAEESGVTSVVDPLGGSYFIENLTSELENRAVEIMKSLEAAGGMIEAIKKGVPQRYIEDSAYLFQRELESGDRKVVGVNCYRDEGAGGATSNFKPDIMAEARQVERLSERKKSRNQKQIQELLQEIKQAAFEDRNIMPSIIEAVRGRVSLGEISNILREVYGEYRAP